VNVLLGVSSKKEEVVKVVETEDELDRENRTLNEFYQEAFGERPFDRHMGIATFCLHMIKLQNHFFKQVRMERNEGIVQNLEGKD
jgi:hypothetical protein